MFSDVIKAENGEEESEDLVRVCRLVTIQL